MKKTMKLLCLCLALVMLLGLAACGGSPAPVQSAQPSQPSAPENPSETDTPANSDAEANTPAASGGVLKMGGMQDTLWLAPWLTNGPATFIVSNFFFDSLLVAEQDGSFTCNLLESYDADPDALTYTLHIKPDIKFHDDTTLDAEAVKWNLENYRDNGAKGNAFLGKLDYVEPVDELTAVLHLTQWDSGIPYALSREAGYMASPSVYKGHETDETFLTQNVCGTGPFKFVSWSLNDKVVGERFDDYWAGKPILDGIEWHVYGDSMTLMSAIQTGDLDIWIDFDTTMYDALDAIESATIFGTVTPELGGNMFVLGFEEQNTNDPLADKRVREAVSYAIDRETINDLVFSGMANCVEQFAVDGSIFAGDIEGHPYDPEKARELLKEAGYENGVDIKCTYKIEVSSDIFTILQGQMADVGINLISNGVENAQYSELLFGWTDGMFLHTSSAPANLTSQMVSMFYSTNKGRMGYADFVITPEMDAVCEQIIASGSNEEAAEYVRELQRIVVDDEVIWAPLTISDQFCIRNNKLQLAEGDWQYFMNYLHAISFAE